MCAGKIGFRGGFGVYDLRTAQYGHVKKPGMAKEVAGSMLV